MDDRPRIVADKMRKFLREQCGVKAPPGCDSIEDIVRSVYGDGMEFHGNCDTCQLKKTYARDRFEAALAVIHNDYSATVCVDKADALLKELREK